MSILSIAKRVLIYNDELVAMLRKCDPDALIAFMRERDLSSAPSSREVAEITLHKARTACVVLSMQDRSLSKRWLIERGYESWDDGDIP